MDEDCQIPVITQVLSNHDPGKIKKSTNGTTLGQSVSRYTRGNPASQCSNQISKCSGIDDDKV